MPIVFVDLETTSVREPWLPGGRRIWQLAVIRREDDGRETPYNRFIRLDELELSTATQQSLEISRFHRHPELNGSDDGVCSGREAAKLMVESGYCGAYLAVLQPGAIEAGDSFTLQPGPRDVGLLALFRARTNGKSF